MKHEEAARILDPETSRDALWEYEDQDERLEVCSEACRIAAEVLRATDVAPVVRCRECKHYKEHRTKKYGNLICRCTRMGKYDMDYPVKPDDFCSYGERTTD